MKKISIITIIIGVFMMIVGIAPLFLPFLMPNNVSSVGIIGGADVPTIGLTYIFWGRTIYSYLAFCGVAVLIIGIVLLIVIMFKKK